MAEGLNKKRHSVSVFMALLIDIVFKINGRFEELSVAFQKLSEAESGKWNITQGRDSIYKFDKNVVIIILFNPEYILCFAKISEYGNSYIAYQSSINKNSNKLK